MTIDGAVMAFAGILILVSLLLATLVSTAWLWLTALIGVNLLQASFTGWCPAALLFRRLGIRPGVAFS